MGKHIMCLASAAALIAGYQGRFLVFNDAPDRIEDLNNRLLEINQSMRTLQATADAEKRPLSTDEEGEIRNLLAEFEQVEDEIDRRKAIEAAGRRLAEPNGRRTDPDDIVDRGGDGGGDRRTTGRRALPQARNPEDAGKWGFKSFGEFAMKVKAGVRGTPDARLIANAAPTDLGQEGVGADGGFAVPPDFRREIMIKVAGEDSLLGRTDQQVSTGNTFTVPTDETTPGSANGIRAYWTAEGGQKTPSKPALNQATVRLNKIAAIVPMTDELLEDAPSLSNYLRTKTPQVFTTEINDVIINGDGVGKPKGILQSGSLITVGLDTLQPADTVTFGNIVNMWSRLDAQYRKNAVWLINQDVEPQLMTLQFPVSSGATAVPAYLPPGGLADAPYGRLLNRPVIPTDATSQLGDVGDIILADLSQYLSITKVGGIRQDVSMHLWFDYDITAFRFVLRVGGQPWWETPITPRNSQLTRSAFVAIEQRA